MKTEIVAGDPKSLTLLEINARYMPHEQYMTLVENVRRDGCLSQIPFVWNDVKSKRRIVLSGNHRTKAAIDAGLTEISWIETSEPLSRQQQVAIQLSHNSISGQDDPATLKRLYDELDTIEWRQYSGLDDKTLGMLDKVDLDALGEANLDFASVQLVFLPAELERAREALKAADTAAVDEKWLAPWDAYEKTLDALATVHTSYKVGNVATAFGVILDTFERHLTDLREGWCEDDAETPKHKGTAPLESLFGTRTIPTDAAVVIERALRKAEKVGDVTPGSRWKLLELLAADYLAAPDEHAVVMPLHPVE